MQHYLCPLFFLHVHTKVGREIWISDLYFIRHDPNQLNYLLRTFLRTFDLKDLILDRGASVFPSETFFH